MSWAFVNGWKAHKIYDGSWARSIRIIEFSIFHIPEKKVIDVRIALLGFAIEVTL